VLELTLTEPPTQYGATHWSSRLLATALAAEGTPISHVTIARIWHRFGVQPWRAGTFMFSTDPQLEGKIRDVVGLYLHLPEKAVVPAWRAWSRPGSADRLEWGQRPSGSPGVDVRGDPVEVWLVEVGLDELPGFALESERSSRAPASPAPDVVRPVFVTVGRGGWAAREARPVSTGVELIGDCTAIAGVRREPACGR
jgi:hypothetical protein